MTEVHLRELITLDKGVSYSGKYLTEDGLPMVNLKCVGRGGGFRLEGTKPYSGPHKERHRIRPGDIVIANTDLTQDGHVIGSPAIVPTSIEEGIISHHLFAVRFTSPQVDPRFLYYRLCSQDFLNHARSRASGATVLGLRPDDALDYQFDLPPISYQEKVGAILGSIDDLIENNRRRIEVLEEMAQAIYREWFVHFRFPGHENATFVDSPLGPIPEDWEVSTCGQELEVLGGGTPSKKEPAYWSDAEIPWFTPSDLTRSPSRFAGPPELRINELGLSKSSARLFPAGSVMMTSRATLGVLAIAQSFATTNQGFIVIPPDDRWPPSFIYEWLRQSAPALEAIATGATFKEITKGAFKKFAFTVPSSDALASFRAAVEPLDGTIKALLSASANLAEQRDLLLPRLVSGEIDVSDLDLDAVLEGAV